MFRRLDKLENKDFMKKYEKSYTTQFELYKEHLSNNMTDSEALRLVRGNYCKMIIL